MIYTYLNFYLQKKAFFLFVKKEMKENKINMPTQYLLVMVTLTFAHCTSAASLRYERAYAPKSIINPDDLYNEMVDFFYNNSNLQLHLLYLCL